MKLLVDLQCCHCSKKVKKILSKFPQIRDQKYEEKANTVTVRVVCCNPEKIRDKLCCKGCNVIKSIEIKELDTKPVVEPENKLKPILKKKTKKKVRFNIPGEPTNELRSILKKNKESPKLGSGIISIPVVKDEEGPKPGSALEAMSVGYPLPWTCYQQSYDGYGEEPSYYGYGYNPCPYLPQPCYCGGGGHGHGHGHSNYCYSTEESSQSCSFM